jgi:predicted porin
MPLGAFTLKATYGEVERSGVPGGVSCAVGNASSTCVAQGKASQLGLGFTYDLSKRTALYGTYAQTDNSGTRFRNGSLVNAGTTYNNLGKDASGYEFGVRHSF